MAGNGRRRGRCVVRSRDEKNLGPDLPMVPDPDATVLAGPDSAAARSEDPDATQLADPALDPDATQLAAPDPDATVLADPDAAPARRVPSADELPTISLEDTAAATVVADAAGAAPTVAVPPARDGIDALDDPYFSPAAPEDLTQAQPMVAIPSPVESLPERKRRLPRWAVALLVVVLLAAAGGVAWYTYEQELWGGRTVPAVVGMSEEDATEALEALGFAVTVDYQSGDDGFGTVLACDPEPGVRADTSAGATLTVAAERVIPDVLGQDVESAKSALNEAGAYNIELTYRNSTEAEGTVLEASPGVGEPFVSSDTVTLTVARPFTVPNVESLNVEDAKALLESEGLSSNVTYVESDAEKYTVVGVSPGVGERVDAGATVELSVSTPYPSEPWDLLAYFDATPQEASAYLAEEGFSPTHAAVYAAGGNADAAYTDADGDVLKVSDSPESPSYAAESTADVLASGAGIGGVRYVFSSASAPEGGTAESEAGVRAVMKACGFEGLVDTCTQDTIAMPQERPEDMPHFICGYGTQGDYTWAVIIGGYEGATRVVALAAPTAHFSAVDLSAYGGRVCDYVAAADLFME